MYKKVNSHETFADPLNKLMCEHTDFLLASLKADIHESFVLPSDLASKCSNLEVRASSHPPLATWGTLLDSSTKQLTT